jgi:large subunit ribosomal protein L6
MSIAVTSRVARKPVTIPKGVEVKMQGRDLAIKGPKGNVVFPVHPLVKVTIEDDTVKVENCEESGYTRTGSGSKLRKSITGTTRASLANVIHGISNLFERKLVLVGVGYKAAMKGKSLGLTLGFSHAVDFLIPEGITIETPTPTEIIVKGLNKELVGLVASKIRAFRSPEPYKGKGVRYSDEVIELKETKKK